VRDVDIRRKVLHVRRAVADIDGHLRYDTPKTRRSRRTVPMDSVLTLTMQTYLMVHRRIASEWFSAHEVRDLADDLPVFVGTALGARQKNEIRLDYSKNLRHGAWYGTHWHRALRAAGLPLSLRFHDLRHTYASWLVAAGVNFKVISEQMGHASIRTTIDRYSHLAEQDAHNVVRAALDGLRSPNPGGNVVHLSSVRRGPG
jgi:integrase